MIMNYHTRRAAGNSRPTAALGEANKVSSGLKKTYHLIASQVKSSPDPWIKKPEDGRADEAEAGEQEVDKEVQ